MTEITSTSILPYFILSMLYIGVASLVVRWSRFYQEKLSLSSDNRFAAIDGLRGFLALGVFFHHAVINYNYRLDGVWRLPDSRFYTMCGQIGVGFFFVITAFLFWSKILQQKGQIDWSHLYLSRIKRIIPMYAVSVVLLLILVLEKSDWILRSLPSELIKGTLAWFSFSFFGSPDINQVAGTSRINAGVFWTLKYEWMFYAGLPLMAMFVRMPIRLALYLLMLFLISLSNEKFLYYFLSGVLAAHVHHEKIFPANISKNLCDVVFITLLASIFFGFDTAYGWQQAIIGSIGFIFLLYGGGLFGLFHFRSTRFLGEISYSIYLLHGLVLTLFIGLANRMPHAISSSRDYWLMTGCAGIFLILVSSLSYRFIENKFISKKTRETSLANAHLLHGRHPLQNDL